MGHPVVKGVDRFPGEPASSFRMRMQLASESRKLSKRVEALERQEGRLRERAALRAFPPGTRVRLTCRCGGESSRRDHEGEWIILYWTEDAGGYKLTRPGSGETTYAVVSSLERIS